MSGSKKSLREELTARLLRARKDLPTSSLGRLGRTAVTALRSGRMMLRKHSEGDPDDDERAIESDFRPAAIGTRLASIIYPGARIDDFVEEARERFLEECDYLHETRSQQRFAELFDDHATIIVPPIHEDFCSRKVLTTTFVAGDHFEEFLASNPPQELRDRIGEALFEFYVGSLFQHGLYNCDPHPGNYLFLPDGKIAMLDYGCTRARACLLRAHAP